VESLGRFGPQRATPNLLALAQEFNLRGALQAQVWYFQFHDLTDPSPGIVEQEQQGFVPHSGTRGEVHRVKQCLHFLLFKVANRFVFRAFEGELLIFVFLANRARLAQV
jgi:hypothetical protein